MYPVSGPQSEGNINQEKAVRLRSTGLRIKALVLVGCLLSCAGYLGVNVGQENDFHLASKVRVQAMEREVNNDYAVLHALRILFETRRDDGPVALDRFAAQALSSYRSLRVLEWAPRVRAPDQTDHYVVAYATQSHRAIGTDLSANGDTASAVLRAVKTGEPTSSGRLPLQDVLFLLPVYDSPDRGESAAWRLQHCRGMLAGIIDTSALVGAAVQDSVAQGIRTYIYDLSAPEATRLLYPAGKAPSRDPHAEKQVYSQKFETGGHEWEIVCVGPDFASLTLSWQPLFFLICGLLVTAGCAFYLYMISKHTSDLASANVHLRAQVENRQKAQVELDYQAHHDLLTGLPNRREFERRFNQAVERAKMSQDTLALFFVDLDGFKSINDTLGHAAGDGVLKAVAERFRTSIGRNDVVARTGGDEFNILLTEAGTGGLADRVAQGLLDAISQPIELSGRFLSLSASIGISLYPENGQDYQELAHCSDAAMYYAKKRGKNRFHRYTKEMAITTRRGLELAMSLRGAIERNELCLFFQPIVGLGVEPTLRFEALVRWRHPEIGLLGPGHFFSLAEENGFAATIGKWVVSEACRLAAKWQAVGRPVGVSINVSGLQFSRPDFLESVDYALVDSGLPPGLLEVELSESSVVGEIEDAMVRLAVLRRKGVTVAIDDFGTGYSSLTYLETLPIDALKIDRSFLPNTESNFRRSSLLRSLIALGRSLNLRVVVSGIEAPRQLELVRGMNPDEVQGFLFSKPLAGTAVVEFIEQWNGKQANPDIERLLEGVRPSADLVLLRPREQVG